MRPCIVFPVELACVRRPSRFQYVLQCVMFQILFLFCFNSFPCIPPPLPLRRSSWLYLGHYVNSAPPFDARFVFFCRSSNAPSVFTFSFAQRQRVLRVIASGYTGLNPWITLPFCRCVYQPAPTASSLSRILLDGFAFPVMLILRPIRVATPVSHFDSARGPFTLKIHSSFVSTFFFFLFRRQELVCQIDVPFPLDASGPLPALLAVQ